MVFNFFNFIIIISKVLSITYPIKFKPDSYILENPLNKTSIKTTGYYNLKIKQNGSEIILTPSLYFPIIMFFNDTIELNKKINENTYSIKYIENKKYEFNIYNSTFQLFNETNISLIYGHSNNSKPNHCGENSKGIFGLSLTKKLIDNNNTIFPFNLYETLNERKEDKYVIFEPHYDHNCNIIESSMTLGQGNDSEFTHAFTVNHNSNENESWSVKLVTLYFSNENNKALRKDGQSIYPKEKKIHFEEGDQRYMILNEDYANQIKENYFETNCALEKIDSKYKYLICDESIDITDLYIQFDDYGYKVDRSLIWENYTVNETGTYVRLRIQFDEESNDLYIFSGILGNFRRKYSIEKDGSTKIYIEKGYCNPDIRDWSQLSHIIIVSIIFLFIVVTAVFVMRMMKKDTNDSINYNNMQQI